MLLVGVVGVLVSATAYAGWSPNVTITGVEVDSNTATYLGLSSMTGKPAACTATQAIILFVNADQQKAQTALATAAYLAGKNVSVHYTGACSGTAQYPVVDALNAL